MKASHKGIFHPKHPDKYLGDAGNIVYRSGWELKFFLYCDRTPGVMKWASEEFHIPYVSPIDGRTHRYFPDVFMQVQATTGAPKHFVIEIKPKMQTHPPIPPTARRNHKRYLQEAATYAINAAKWAAAEHYCQQRAWTFLVLTEDHLFERMR